MVKKFFVRPGHFAQSGGLWYEAGILLLVEPHELVEVFADRNGEPGACLGRHSFSQLDEQAPPAGLLRTDNPTDLRLHLRSGPRAAA
ncbi:MAG: hypothetical protein KIT36_22785 [Alphaproteobacteria bacterium]|nr:hypothetical protein [Alphaproteobacteria bacterium]